MNTTRTLYIRVHQLYCPHPWLRERNGWHSLPSFLWFSPTSFRHSAPLRCFPGPLRPSFDFSTLPALQAACPSVQSMLASPSLYMVSVPFLRSSVLCDFSPGVPRPLVPAVLRQQLFLSLHSLFHPGTLASRRLLSSKFVLPGLAKDVGLWTRSCLSVRRARFSHTSSVSRISVPGHWFFRVHLDLVGLLPSCPGFSYLLTMINRTSRWPEAVPLASITTADYARAIISTWVSSFGVPALLTSDWGSQFTSSVWSEVCSILGIRGFRLQAFTLRV